ncbi:MAG: polysaccharide deacetylase family protein [Fluviicola sp.]|nr:polysaccharide deacetylase family protein [Fluviicola sp.]
MILVLVEEITNRIQTTFDFIFKLRGIHYELTTSVEFFEESSFKKFNYTQHKSRSFSIQPSALLQENEWREQRISKALFEDEECLSFDEIIDPIASIFYVLTRFEEYNSTKMDEHNRFPFSESILKKYDWIERAKCDRWAKQIIELTHLSLPQNETEIVPTFDIDNTFAYQLKRGKQKYLSILKDVIRLNINRLSERKKVQKGEVDPYDTFATIKNVALRFPKTKLFWLVGKRAKKDRNISLSIAEHQALIKEMDAVAEVNLHPSYASNDDFSTILKEKKALEDVLGRKISSSRQHFLRLQLPTTFQALQKAEFSHEYSMGFAEALGFRCGTARAHQWFDLSKNEVTELTVHPFVYMDGTLNEYMKLSVEQSKMKIKELYCEVKQYGGDFVFLWHNETIGNYGIWKGWSEVLDFTLNLEDE